MQNEKNNSTKSIALVLGVLVLWMPSAKAVSGQDAAVKIGLSIAGAIAGKAVTRSLFPEQGIDYKKIRVMMEEVVHKQVTAGAISTVEGELKSLNTYINTAIYAKGKTNLERYNDLKEYAVLIRGYIGGISSEFYALESLATYVVGAQVELAVLSAMYFFAKEAKSDGEMNTAEMLFYDRLSDHYNQMSYIRAVQKQIVDRRKLMSSCTTYGNRFKGWKVWLQDNDFNGVQTVRNWYKDVNYCNAAREEWGYHNIRPFIIGLNAKEKFGWMQDIEQSWFDLGLKRGIFTKWDRIRNVKIDYGGMHIYSLDDDGFPY